MGKRWCWRRLAVAASVAGLLAPAALADRDSDLAAVASAVAARSQARIERAYTNPFPLPHPDTASPAVGNAAWALAALWKDVDADLANARLVEIRDAALPDAYWAMGLLIRTHELFRCDSLFFPGRLTPEAEAALRDLFRVELELHSRVIEADPAGAWVIDDSENHDIMRRSLNLLASGVLATDPAHASLALADGRTLAEHHEAWTAFFVAYLQERARRGLFVERGSPTYAKYTVQSLFNLRDFALSRDVRELAGKLLDLYFADALHETIDGVRGGAKSRSYHDTSSAMGTSDSMRAYHHVLLGMPASLTGTGHPSTLHAATSAYRIPRAIMDLGVFAAERGRFTYRGRAPARGTRVTNPAPNSTFHYTARFPQDMQRVTLVSPEWVAGAHVVNPARTYMQIHSQNRWFGVIFRGGVNSRAYAQCEALDAAARTAYDEMTGVAEGDAMIIQRLPQSTGGDLRVYFSNDLLREEAGGWVFARDPAAGGFLGVRAARGAQAWDPPDPAYPNGAWLRVIDRGAPVVFQLGIASDFGGDFAAFQARVQATGLSWPAADELRYQPLSGQELTWWTDARPPQIGGVAVSLNAGAAFDSPFLSWADGALSGTITSTPGYGSREHLLDFNVPAATPARLVVEAESGDLGAPVSVGSDPAASGAHHVEAPAGSGGGGSMSADISVPVAGTWHLWARMLAPAAASNELHASVDGGPVTVLAAPAPGAAWQWVRGSAHVLAAGRHRLVITSAADGTRLDQVVLTTDGDDAPPNTVTRDLADSDADGVPDAWAQRWLGAPRGDAAARTRAEDDLDGDGETNGEEYLAGTDPTVAADALRLDIAKPAGPVARFLARALAPSPGACPRHARVHDLETAPAPTGPWAPVPGGRGIEGAGVSVSVPLPGSEPLAFYLVRPSIR